MAGYIGSKASVVSSGAERKKTFAITTTTTALTGLVYTPTKVHVFHNGVRLVDGTDFTATNSTSITLTVAAESGDQVVVVSYASFQTSDTVSASAGGTFGGNVTVTGTVTVDGGSNGTIDFGDVTTAYGRLYADNTGTFVGSKTNQPLILRTNNSEAMRITAAGSVGINTSSPDSYYAKKLVVDCGTDGQNGITIKSSTTGAGMFAFADGTSGSDRYRGYINYNHANDSMTLGTAGGAGILTIDATGAVTMPTQPAFLARLGTAVSNIPANNSSNRVVFNTEIFDQNSDYNVNGIFTAPVTGKYQLQTSIYFTNLDTAASYYIVYITTSNNTFYSILDPNFAADLTYYNVGFSILVDMDAGDTATVDIIQQHGTAQTGIAGNTSTNFSGYLVA